MALNTRKQGGALTTLNPPIFISSSLSSILYPLQNRSCSYSYLFNRSRSNPPFILNRPSSPRKSFLCVKVWISDSQKGDIMVLYPKGRKPLFSRSYSSISSDSDVASSHSSDVTSAHSADVTPFLKYYFVRLIFISTFLGIFYILCLKFNLMDFFHALLSKVGFSLGGRALSFALRGLGCSAGLALTVYFALRALLTYQNHMMSPESPSLSGSKVEQFLLGDSPVPSISPGGMDGDEATSNLPNRGEENQAPGRNEAGAASSAQPPIGGDDNPSSSFFKGIFEPGEEINSEPSQGVGQQLPLVISSPGISGESLLRDLEQPGGEPAPQPEAAQPGQVQEGPPGEVFEKINTRLLFAADKKTGWQPPIEKINTLITLKSQVISRMAELDPDPFWLESRNRLLADSILTKKNWEYSPETLTKRLSQLNEHGRNSSFFRELRALREESQN